MICIIAIVLGVFLNPVPGNTVVNVKDCAAVRKKEKIIDKKILVYIYFKCYINK